MTGGCKSGCCWAVPKQNCTGCGPAYVHSGYGQKGCGCGKKDHHYEKKDCGCKKDYHHYEEKYSYGYDKHDDHHHEKKGCHSCNKGYDCYKREEKKCEKVCVPCPQPCQPTVIVYKQQERCPPHVKYGCVYPRNCC